MFHEKDDGLPVGRYLDRAQRHSFGQHVAGVPIERRAAQAQAHAVGVLPHLPRGVAQRACAFAGGGYANTF